MFLPLDFPFSSSSLHLAVLVWNLWMGFVVAFFIKKISMERSELIHDVLVHIFSSLSQGTCMESHRHVVIFGQQNKPLIGKKKHESL